MTTLLELAKKLHNTLALYNGAGYALGWKTEKVDKLLDESKRVIELADQPQQEPETKDVVINNMGDPFTVKAYTTPQPAHHKALAEQPQQDDAWKAEQKTLADEAVKCATEALANPNHPATMAAREYYGAAQPQQKPVGTYGEIFESMRALLRSGRQADQQVYMAMQDKPLYTSPPARRTWVGLTDEEIYSVLENLQVMHHRPPTTDSRVIFARAIEAKLRSKNEDRN